MTALFLTVFPLTQVEHNATKESDHTALLIKIQTEPLKHFAPCSGSFLYEEMWQKHENYDEMVREASERGDQHGHDLGNFWRWLHGVTRDMKQWSYKTFGSVLAEIKHLRRKLDAARPEVCT
jgi:hypothetical protein